MDKATSKVFSFCPDEGGANSTLERQVYEANFGDGYKLRLQNGINNVHEKWELTFNNRRGNEVAAIDAFLRDVGASAFDFSPPNIVAPIRVVCDNWTMDLLGKTSDGTIYGSVRASFTRVYGL